MLPDRTYYITIPSGSSIEYVIFHHCRPPRLALSDRHYRTSSSSGFLTGYITLQYRQTPRSDVSYSITVRLPDGHYLTSSSLCSLTDTSGFAHRQAPRLKILDFLMDGLPGWHAHAYMVGPPTRIYIRLTYRGLSSLMGIYIRSNLPILFVLCQYRQN